MCVVVLYRSSMPLKVGTMLLPPSGMRDTLHNWVIGSLHPQSIISPLYVTLQPVLWKIIHILHLQAWMLLAGYWICQEICVPFKLLQGVCSGAREELLL